MDENLLESALQAEELQTQTILYEVPSPISGIPYCSFRLMLMILREQVEICCKTEMLGK